MMRVCHIANAAAVLLATVGSMLAPTLANAQNTETARLVYERAEGARDCPSEQAIRDGVAARLGYDPFIAESAREVRVRIRPKEADGGFAARIELHAPDLDSPRGRNLESSGERCDELVQALIFTVTVAIDPSSTVHMRSSGEPAAEQKSVMAAVLRVHDAHGAARTAGAEAAAEPEEPPPPPPEPPEPRNPLSLRAAAGGGIALGMAPKPAGHFRLQLALAQPRWSVGLAGSATLPVRSDVESGGTLETSLLLGEVTPCWRLNWMRFCGLGVAGALRTTGLDLSDTASNAHLYAAVGARFGAEFPLVNRLHLRADAQVLGTLARTRVLVDGDPVWRTPDFSGGLAVTVVFDLF